MISNDVEKLKETPVVDVTPTLAHRTSSYKASSNDYKNEENNKLIASIFSKIAGNIDSYQFQIQVNQVLLQKRQRATSTNEYIVSLINNVTFYIEMEKEMNKILALMLNSENIPSPENLENQLVRIKTDLKHLVPTVAQQNRQIYNSKYETNNQIVEALQFDYAYHSLKQNLMITLLDILTSNPDTTRELFNSPATYIINVTNNYINTYINMKLENLRFM